MAKDGTTLLLLGGAGLVAYYGYTQGWFASWGFAPAATTASNAATSPTSSNCPSGQYPLTVQGAFQGCETIAQLRTLIGPVNVSLTDAQVIQLATGQPMSSGTAITPTPPVIQSPATTPQIPAGPSLASMLAGLQSQIAANPQDPSLVTSGGVTSAVCDVFNFYLVAANVGVSDGMLDCSDHTTQIPLSQYWAWAAPQLQAKIPGLSGLGHVYAGLGQLVRQRKGGW